MKDRIQPHPAARARPVREEPLFEWPPGLAPRGRVLPLTVAEAQRLAAALRYWLIEQGQDEEP